MSFSELDALSTRAAVFVLEGMQLKIVAENNWTASSLSFSSDLVRRVHARASVERRRREKRGLRTWAGLEITQEARVAFSCASSNYYASFVHALQISQVLNSSTHAL